MPRLRIRVNLLTLFLIAAALPAHAGVLAIDGVRVVDTRQGTVSDPQCVRVQDTRIATIRPAGDAGCRRNATIVDGANRFLMPGLIDMHAHLTLGPFDMLRERGVVKMQALADDGIADFNARRLIAFGVTTIRNPGGDLDAAGRYERRRSGAGFVGPESFNAGPVINNAAIAGLAEVASSRQELEALIDAQVADGADWIKLYTGLSEALLDAAVDAAERHGVPTVAHLDRVAWPRALELGIDALVHLMPISPDLLSAEARKRYAANARPGTFAFFEWWEHFDPDGPQGDALVDAFNEHRPVFDATLVAFHAAFLGDEVDNVYRRDTGALAHPRLQANWNDWFTFTIGWRPGDFERARAVWPKIERLAERLYATDALVTIGSDMSNPWIAPGISVHREMQLLADAGVPPATIVRAATCNAAEALGVSERLGRVAPGFEADLLLLDTNPLSDVRNALSIHAVINNGRLFDDADLRELMR